MLLERPGVANERSEPVDGGLGLLRRKRGGGGVFGAQAEGAHDRAQGAQETQPPQDGGSPGPGPVAGARLLQLLQAQRGVRACVPVPLAEEPGRGRAVPLPVALRVSPVRSHGSPCAHQAFLSGGGQRVHLRVHPAQTLTLRVSGTTIRMLLDATLVFFFLS